MSITDASTTTPQVDTWSAWHIDPAHSLVEFSVRHMMLSNVRGRFTGISGTVVDAGEDPKRSSVKAAIDVTTLITGDPQRDEHLRSADFFDVAKYPSMAFESRRIVGSRDKFTVTGDLTIHGQTREVTLDVTFTTPTPTPNPGSSVMTVMTDFLETVIDAHGGLERWNQLNTVSARLLQGGALWPLKGQAGVLDDVVVTASLHEERVSHRPFGAAGRRSAFTPERVAIESSDGTVIEALDQPRASFAGHTLETPWSTLQLAYFVGTAMWTYLTQPFTFTLPGFSTSELEPWDESGNRWRRLRVTWPGYLATHSTEQTLYFDDNGLLARHDYDVEISGGSNAPHYVSEYVEVAGIRLPTKHRILPRTPDGQSLAEPLIVSIDLSEIAFT